MPQPPKEQKAPATRAFGQTTPETYGTEEFLMSVAVDLETTVIIESAVRTLPNKAI